jgi:hypothetical protein
MFSGKSFKSPSDESVILQDEWHLKLACLTLTTPKIGKTFSLEFQVQILNAQQTTGSMIDI